MCFLAHLECHNLVGLPITSFIYNTVCSSSAFTVLFNFDVPIHCVYQAPISLDFKYANLDGNQAQIGLFVVSPTAFLQRFGGAASKRSRLKGSWITVRTVPSYQVILYRTGLGLHNPNLCNDQQVIRGGWLLTFSQIRTVLCNVQYSLECKLQHSHNLAYRMGLPEASPVITTPNSPI